MTLGQSLGSEEVRSSPEGQHLQRPRPQRNPLLTAEYWEVIPRTGITHVCPSFLPSLSLHCQPPPETGQYYMGHRSGDHLKLSFCYSLFSYSFLCGFFFLAFIFLAYFLFFYFLFSQFFLLSSPLHSTGF